MPESKHFKLNRDDAIKIDEMLLFRIEATRDTAFVKKGDLGGYIEREDIIEGENAWLGENAIAYGEHTKIKGNSLVGGYSVLNNSRISGNSIAENSILIDSVVMGQCYVHTGSKVVKSMLTGNAEIISSKLENIIAGKNLVVNEANLKDKRLMTTQKNYIVVGDEQKINFSDLEEYEMELEGQGIMVREAFSKKHKVDTYYEYTGITKLSSDGEVLHQIKAKEAIHDVGVLKGEVGGYVSSLTSLKNGAWVGEGNMIGKGVSLDGAENSILYGSSEILSKDDIPVAKAKSDNEQKRRYQESLKQKATQIKL